MILKVKGEFGMILKVKGEGEPSNTVEFKLEKDDDGDVSVYANGGRILYFRTHPDTSLIKTKLAYLSGEQRKLFENKDGLLATH
jgi:hypothetical protein